MTRAQFISDTKELLTGIALCAAVSVFMFGVVSLMRWAIIP